MIRGWGGRGVVLWGIPCDDHLKLQLNTGPEAFTSHQPTGIPVHGLQAHGGRVTAGMFALKISIFRRNQSHTDGTRRASGGPFLVEGTSLWTAPMKPSSLPGQDT